MKKQDYTVSVTVKSTAQEAFGAINNVRGWWSEEIEGRTDKLNEEFKYHYEDVHRSKMKIIEFIPNKRVVWHVLDNYFNFIQDETEWKDTKIIFEITEKDNKTQIQFTHLGLVAAYECFDICSNAWMQYIQQSLSSLITSGKGQPNGRNKISTKHEKQRQMDRK
jgi:Activator of Hsp90 ATPase homolog 1-like protein